MKKPVLLHFFLSKVLYGELLYLWNITDDVKLYYNSPK